MQRKALNARRSQSETLPSLWETFIPCLISFSRATEGRKIIQRVIDIITKLNWISKSKSERYIPYNFMHQAGIWILSYKTHRFVSYIKYKIFFFALSSFSVLYRHTLTSFIGLNRLQHFFEQMSLQNLILTTKLTYLKIMEYCFMYKIFSVHRSSLTSP